MDVQSESYEKFWPLYLHEHRKPWTRALHVVGTVLAVALLSYGVLTASWRFVIAAPIVGYALAWLSHFVVEQNVPATMRHPLWSLVSDFRMASLWLTGRLGSEIERVERRQASPPLRAEN